MDSPSWDEAAKPDRMSKQRWEVICRSRQMETQTCILLLSSLWGRRRPVCSFIHGVSWKRVHTWRSSYFFTYYHWCRRFLAALRCPAFIWQQTLKNDLQSISNCLLWVAHREGLSARRRQKQNVTISVVLEGHSVYQLHLKAHRDTRGSS